MRLGKLPKTLEEAYDEIYARIKAGEGSAPEIAYKAFQWILCSVQPISPTGLVAAVCQDSTTDDIQDVDIDINFVLGSCQNLLKIESTKEADICRFAHLSVQEYLEKSHWDPTQTNSLVSEVCLIILNDPDQQRLHRILTDSIGDEEYLLANPIKEVNLYANRHWMTHVQRCAEERVDMRLVTLLKKFLGAPEKSAQAYQAWLYVASKDRRYAPFQNSMLRLQPSNLPSLPIAMFGMQRFLQDWWENIDPEQQNHHGTTLLGLAARGNCYSTVQSLLDKGADINACGDKSSLNPRAPFGELYRETALYVASELDHVAIARLLVERGADVNVRCGVFGSALQAASFQGNESIVRLLLDEKANVNADDGQYGNALQAASSNGYENVVKMLLKEGADVNAQGG